MLWEDDEDRSSYIKQLRKDLLDTFREVGIENVITVVRGGISIAQSECKCDYFDYLSGDSKAYNGEYMR